jgi:hypothetical protein
VATLVSASSSDPADVESAASAVFATLATKAQDQGELNLTEVTEVVNVITETLATTGTELPPAVTAGAAAVISALNQVKEELIQTAGTSEEAVVKLTQAQGVAQGAVAESLQQTVTGAQTIDDVVAGYSGETLQEAVTNAPVGDITGTEVRSGYFEFSRASFRISENGSFVPGSELVINRLDGNKGSVTLTVTLTDGTASAASGDFQAGTLQVVFGDGEISKQVPLSGWLRDDELVEGEESVGLSLSLSPGAPAGAGLGLQTSATLVVLDNDYPGTFSFSASQYRVREDGVAEVPVRVTRTGGNSGAVTLVLTPSELAGGAMGGLDFVLTPFEVRFENGNWNRLVTVPVLADNLWEADEPFKLSLSLGVGAPVGAAVGTPSEALVAISNDFVRRPQAIVGLAALPGTGLWRVIVSGTAGQRFELQASSDLARWTPIHTAVLGATPSDVLDSAGNQQVRFYRVRFLP